MLLLRCNPNTPEADLLRSISICNHVSRRDRRFNAKSGKNSAGENREICHAIYKYKVQRISHLPFDIVLQTVTFVSEMGQLVYRVNAKDVITFVDSNWSVFARENGMLLAPPELVVGTSLWKHISDATTRHFYKLFLERVRKSKETIIVPFRCDAPGKPRFMELHIVHLSKTELEFRSVLVKKKRRGPARLPDLKTPRNDELILMCVWCKRVKVSDWRVAEDALKELSLFEKATLPLISHVVCPACESQALKAVVE